VRDPYYAIPTTAQAGESPNQQIAALLPSQVPSLPVCLMTLFMQKKRKVTRILIDCRKKCFPFAGGSNSQRRVKAALKTGSPS